MKWLKGGYFCYFLILIKVILVLHGCKVREFKRHKLIYSVFMNKVFYGSKIQYGAQGSIQCNT